MNGREMFLIFAIGFFSGVPFGHFLMGLDTFSPDEITECRANLEWCAKEKPRLYKSLTEKVDG